MAYSERKMHYAAVGRLIRRSDTDPALVAKYDLLRSDADRFQFMREILLAPTLADVVVEDHYKSFTRDRHTDRYVTVTWLHFLLQMFSRMRVFDPKP